MRSTLTRQSENVTFDMNDALPWLSMWHLDHFPWHLDHLFISYDYIIVPATRSSSLALADVLSCT